MNNNEMILLETIIKNITYKILESKKNDSTKKNIQIVKILKDPKINHAEIMRQLWHPSPSEEDTYRSLFSKKLRGMTNANNSPYRFTQDEIGKIFSILQSK